MKSSFKDFIDGALYTKSLYSRSDKSFLFKIIGVGV